MSKDLHLPLATRFGLDTFAELLPERDFIVGEDPGSFPGFREGMMRSLIPFTPYECVIAENLIAIEWELLQHRCMREASLRNQILSVVYDAAKRSQRIRHEAAVDAAFEKFIEAGGDEDDWEDPFEFDAAAAEAFAEELAEQAISPDPELQAKARDRILELGLDPVRLMSDAYRDGQLPASDHDRKIQELERRRREVKRDYDALQKTRPVEGEIIEG